MLNQQNFKIGEQFEDYIAKHLFPTELYDLIHRTNTYEQNKERYAEDTLRPDFKFRCKKTLTEFYVEAKYRSRFDSIGKIEIAHLKQFRRFEALVKGEKTPVFFVIGYGGTSNEPEGVSLIPIQKVEYLTVYKNFLLNYEVGSKAVISESLDFSIPNHSDFKNTAVVNESKKNKVLLFLVPLILVVLSLLYFYPRATSSPEEALKKQLQLYYDTIEKGDIRLLDQFISPVVENWYGKTNVPVNEVIDGIIDYQKKYPDIEIHVIWDSFKYRKEGDVYFVDYELFYKINTIHKKYHLKINLLFNKDLKIESINEIKL